MITPQVITRSKSYNRILRKVAFFALVQINAMKLSRLLNVSITTLLAALVIGCNDTVLDEVESTDSHLSRSLITDQAIDSIEHNSSYYWADNGKVPLHKIVGKYLVIYRSSNHDNMRRKASVSGTKLNEVVDARGYVYKFKEKSSRKTTMLENVELEMATVQANSADIDSIMSDAYYYAPYYLLDDGTEVGVRNTFYVKLKSDSDLPRLKEFADRYCVNIVDKISPSDRWYTVSCSMSSKYNALELANIFHECGSFEFSCPELLGLGRFDAINEPFYASGKLWHLGNNTACSYAHINYNASREIISKASSDVVVAIIDTGVDVNHRDLYNVLPGWDAETGSSSDMVYDYHGTMVAGFIAAIPNNNQDVAGVGYGATILPISLNLNGFKDIISEASAIARAFDYAIDNGAKIINCSWHFNEKYKVITDAINRALNKGCLVVFASGNDVKKKGDDVYYPANSDSRILVVGAIDKYGKRVYLSNYGERLDVVAPGEDVWSTSPNNSIMIGTGTSFAAPQVSGLAAMILSKYPDETIDDVKYRIKKSAVKIGSYKYDYRIKDSPRQSNMKWNNEMGYGLIDACAALAPEMPYPLMVQIKNSSGFMPTGAFRIEITTPDYKYLPQYSIETGIANTRDIFSARYDILPGKYNVTAICENAGGIEQDFEFTIEKGGVITFEYTGETFNTLGWSDPTFESYTWISVY